MTPLLFAADKGQTSVARALLEKGADMEVKGGKVRSVWSYGTHCGPYLLSLFTALTPLLRLSCFLDGCRTP